MCKTFKFNNLKNNRVTMIRGSKYDGTNEIKNNISPR